MAGEKKVGKKSEKGLSLYWKIGLIIGINLILLLAILFQNLASTRSAKSDGLIMMMWMSGER